MKYFVIVLNKLVEEEDSTSPLVLIGLIASMEEESLLNKIMIEKADAKRYIYAGFPGLLM